MSLDAATVAGLWCFAFARSMGLHLPVLAPLLLGMGTWLVYVIDRILDGLRPDQALRKRHYFYAAHRSVFLWAALAVGSCLGWLTLTRMPSEVRREDSLLFVAALIYFCLVHSRLSERWLPTALAVGLLFAAGTAVPTWAGLSIGHARLVPAVALFAALCWLNCVAIECWEQPSRLTYQPPIPGRAAHVFTRWAGAHLQKLWAAVGLAAAILAVGSWIGSGRGLLGIYLAACVSAILSFLLRWAAPRLGADQLRVAADAALLTPILFLPLFRG